MDKYLIIHGSFGSPESNWFPWLKTELENQNKKVDVPQFPIGANIQNFESWSNLMTDINVDNSTIIIAHSIAPAFVCKYMIVNKIKVKKLIFVCGFNNFLGINEDYDNVNEPMFIDNISKVKDYCNDIICYYTDNDPYVPYKIEKQFADNVSHKQYLIKNGGHLNQESGFSKFEEILKNFKPINEL